MRAVYTEKDKIVFEREDKVPDLNNNEVLIKVTGCGVCGTDLHIYRGEVPLAKPPVVLGHEITGIVEKSADIKPGTPVAVDPVIPCHKCYYCHHGKPNLCKTPTIIGYHWDGGFQGCMKAPRSQVYPITENCGVKGGILIEPVACVINGYDKLNLRPGSTVLIMGAGPIGLIWMQMFKYSPVKFIAQTDLIEERCRKAAKLGADCVMNTSKVNLTEYSKEHFPEGFDIVVDATGDPRAVEEGIRLTANMGMMMIFGLCPKGSTATIDPLEVYQKEMKILSSKMPPLTFERAIRLIESGKIDYNKIVSHVFPLKKLPEALEKFENEKDKVLKMMIDPRLE